MTEKIETQDRKQVPTINSTKIPVTTNTQMKTKDEAISKRIWN